MEPDLHERLDGQVALVSGANRGIGAVATARLAELGATVFAGARDPAQMGDVEEASEGHIHAVRLDVTSLPGIQAAVREAVDGGGRLDILVNNAGVGDWKGRTLETLEPSLLDKVLATNLRGPMLLTQAALGHLLEREGGRVVNVSSGMGALGEGMSGSAPAYRVSKTALNGFTRYLHGEYGPRGLIANCVCPGWVRTRMGGSNARRSPDEGADTAVWLARFRPGSPAGLFWRDRKAIDW